MVVGCFEVYFMIQRKLVALAVLSISFLPGCHRYNAIRADVEARRVCREQGGPQCAELWATQPVADRIWNNDLQDMGLAVKAPDGSLQPTYAGAVVGSQSGVWIK
jgi:hypothetical protein